MSDRVVEWRADAWWDRLGWDLTELILSKLPLRSMLRASAVCKPWRAVLQEHKQQQQQPPGRPWLFLHGHNNVAARLGRTTFAYDPDDGDSWISFTLPPDCFAGAGGFAFASPSPSRLSFAPLLRGAAWTHAPPLAASRCNPVVAAVPSGFERRRLLLVVGGARFVGGLVDIEDPLPTELYDYDPSSSAAAAEDGGASRWEQCAPLPAEFGTGSSSSLWLSSALVRDGRFFFVCGTYSCTVSAFDLRRREWTAPRELRPAPGLVAAFVASGRGGRRLVLAGVEEEGGGAFGVWDVEPSTLAARKVGEMPAELVGCMLPGSLRCVGQDGVLYVFSEEQHRAYPACACEVDEEGCRWRKLPPLPVEGSSALSRFHKMVAFCSPVLLRHHLPTSSSSISTVISTVH